MIGSRASSHWFPELLEIFEEGSIVICNIVCCSTNSFCLQNLLRPRGAARDIQLVSYWWVDRHCCCKSRRRAGGWYKIIYQTINNFSYSGSKSGIFLSNGLCKIRATAGRQWP